MKKAKILADKYMTQYSKAQAHLVKAGAKVIEDCKALDVLWVGDIHDEWQADVADEHVEAFIEICKVAFREAGEFFDYNLPIDCDAKVGETWAETH